MADESDDKLRTLIVDDEPLAVERMQVICAKIDALQVVGTASDGAQALRLIGALARGGRNLGGQGADQGSAPASDRIRHRA